MSEQTSNAARKEESAGLMKYSAENLVPFGPIHPALKEPEYFKLVLEGERIVEVIPRIGYVHRGLEKAAESRPWVQNMYMFERTCGICSFVHSLTYGQAVEGLTIYEIPRRAKFIRTIIAEMERIHSHLLWVGLMGHWAGFETLFMWVWRDREVVLDLVEAISGNRVHKSMNAFCGVRRDMPEGMEVMDTPADLKCLQPFDPIRTPMGQQLKALDLISRALKRKALFLDTVFNAWNTLRRNLLKEAMPKFMTEHPDALVEALKIVNQNLIRYSLASLERGSAGIFFSVPASAESLTLEQYEKFMRPFDLDFLKAIAGKRECHVLHAHGEKLYLDRLLDYPVQALSWADLNGGPIISEARKRTSLTLMAGIDHVKFPYVSAKVIRDQVKSAIAQAGNTKFILAPGCSVPTYSFPPLINSARDALRVSANRKE
ncbi:MAG: uroporphyrinogen decarboxylase family protein [Thermodesulfobacteriota bacterium]